MTVDRSFGSSPWSECNQLSFPNSLSKKWVLKKARGNKLNRYRWFPPFEVPMFDFSYQHPFPNNSNFPAIYSAYSFFSLKLLLGMILLAQDLSAVRNEDEREGMGV